MSEQCCSTFELELVVWGGLRDHEAHEPYLYVLSFDDMGNSNIGFTIVFCTLKLHIELVH
jgi:hypothetical protein